MSKTRQGWILLSDYLQQLTANCLKSSRYQLLYILYTLGNLLVPGQILQMIRSSMLLKVSTTVMPIRMEWELISRSTFVLPTGIPMVAQLQVLFVSMDRVYQDMQKKESAIPEIAVQTKWRSRISANGPFRIITISGWCMIFAA